MENKWYRDFQKIMLAETQQSDNDWDDGYPYDDDTDEDRAKRAKALNLDRTVSVFQDVGDYGVIGDNSKHVYAYHGYEPDVDQQRAQDHADIINRHLATRHSK